MEKSSSNLHLVMFPWFAFGHLIPFLHLSNKLAQRGHRVSFVLPKGPHSKLQPLNHHPHLIRFFPLLLPHVPGLPADAHTTSDVPSLSLQQHLVTAYDLCKDQLQLLLASLNPKPDFVFTDFGYWVPSVAREMGIKTIACAVVPAATLAWCVPNRKVVKGMPEEELIEPPAGYPSLRVRFKPNEAHTLRMHAEEFGSGVLFYDRLLTRLQESDAIAVWTCREIEAQFCDYIARQYQKPVLLTGPVLQESSLARLEQKWVLWLGRFEPGSVVFCAFGSQIELQKDQYQELLLGFESCGHPFLVALAPPRGCLTVEEALPESFRERIGGSGWVHGGWVPQASILNHPAIGCFVNHGGSASMWESLLCESRIVLVPNMAEHIVQARLLVEELKVAVEVERRGENRWISKESLSEAIELVMDKSSEVASTLKANHDALRTLISREGLDKEYIDAFVDKLQDLKDSQLVSEPV